MHELQYKVSARGKITAYRGSKKLSAIWLEQMPTITARKALRKQLDPVLVRAAWVLFGRKCLPGDINTVVAEEKLVRQVMADDPRMLSVIYHYVQAEDLSPMPYHSIVRRCKALLLKEGFEKRSMPFHRYNSDKKVKVSDVNSYWASQNHEGLTEAGWRYLHKMPYAQLREQMTRGWRLVYQLGAISMLADAEVPKASNKVIDFLSGFSSAEMSQDSLRNLYIATRDMAETEQGLVYSQVDAVQDWLRDSKPIIEKGSSWNSLVEKAVVYKLTTEMMEKAALEQLKWPAVIEPFVSNDGLVVRPLLNGVELFDEGNTMNNCLKNMKHYAVEGMKQKSAIFSISGVAGRATVEFIRRVGTGWRLKQAEESDNKPIANVALLRAVDQLEQRMRTV